MINLNYHTFVYILTRNIIRSKHGNMGPVQKGWIDYTERKLGHLSLTDGEYRDLSILTYIRQLFLPEFKG